MVLRPLPKQLVKQIRAFAKKKPNSLAFFASRLKNADHREFLSFLHNPKTPLKTLQVVGGRVRSLNVKRKFPKIGEAILKRVHGTFEKPVTALEVISSIRKKVSLHNAKYGSKNYYLLKPIAYPVGKEFVLMFKVNKFSVEEFKTKSTLEQLVKGSIPKENTPARFLYDLSLKTKKPISKLQEELDSAFELLNERVGLGVENFLVVGYKNKKFIFVPLIDLF